MRTRTLALLFIFLFLLPVCASSDQDEVLGSDSASEAFTKINADIAELFAAIALLGGDPLTMLDLEYGGLGDDISAYTGLLGISGGAVQNVDTEAELEARTGLQIATEAEAQGYVTTHTNVYNAYTILAATTDNTPAALTVGEQTVVGRATGGAIAALAIDSDLQSTSSDHDTLPSAKAVLDILKAGWTVDLTTLVNNEPVLVTHLSLVAGEALGAGSILYMKTDATNGGRMYLYNADSTDADNDTYRFFGKAVAAAAGVGSAVTVRLFSPMWVMRQDSMGLTYNQDEGLSLVVAESGTGYEVLYSSAPSGAGDHVEFTGLILQCYDETAGTQDIVLFFGGFDMNVIPAAAP